MACRLPGSIDSPNLLWEALLRGDDLITEIPPDRWDADEYYDPEPGVPGRSVSRWGAFIDDVGGFDSEFFGINEREATAIDPQHRLLMETSFEAVEHAGLTPTAIAKSLTGVFVGLTHGDYQLLAADARSVEGPYGFTGTSFSMASGRVAYALGVHGPAMTLDSACSSGLLAVHMACRSLHDGESDLALAGGATVLLDPRKFSSGSAQGMLSPTGRCHAFDAAADGFVPSEGCAIVLLKRLVDAQRDGDQILAVVRGSAANQDGHTVNIATPSETAQTRVYRSALAAAGLDPATVGMVEAHGPGTPVGDPIEYASLANVYGIDGPCALASVKTNFGHAQAASGGLSLIKTVLALQHGAIPKNLHFDRLPDDLDRIETKLFVPQSITEWPTNGTHARRAAVSSYGLSGTNVHLILEQAPEQAHAAPPATATGVPQMFALSSTSAEELRRTAGRLANWTSQQAGQLELSDLAYTLARRRGHRSVRTAIIASGVEELTRALQEVADGETPFPSVAGNDDRGPVWVFSGQGSQWAAMGAQLLSSEPIFAATIAELEPLIADESGFSVTDAMSSSQTVTGIDRVQPTIFAMQVGLAATMNARGVRPGAVIGHSMGETAAAVVAGALSLADGARVICRRSRLMASIAGAGAMASVELPAQHVLSELMAHGVNDVDVAVVASPQSTVIGGEPERIRELVATWENRDIMAREVAVDVASHTPHVDPIIDELTAVLADLEPLTPELPYYSATLFDPRDEPICDAAYWADNLRHTVRFAAAVQAALEDGYRIFTELSPHPLLTHAMEQNAHSLDVSVAALAGMRREQDLPHGLLGLLADLHCAGAAVDFSVLYPTGRLVDAPLPTWTHRPLLLNRDNQETQTHGGSTVSVHPLLGSHVRLPEEPERHAWDGDVGIGALPWLGDHQVHRVAALPGAAYCEMALAAARTIVGEQSEVRNIRFEQMLLLDEKTPVNATCTVAAPGVVQFLVETAQDDERVRRAVAQLHAAHEENRPTPYDVAGLLAAHATRIDGVEMRKWFDERGIQYGPAFTGLAATLTGEETVSTLLAEVALPRSIRSQHDAYGVHPALLDACFQSVAAHPDVQRAAGGGLLLPLGVSRLRAYASTRNARYCYTRITKAQAGAVEVDLDLLDEHGTVLSAVSGLTLGTGTSEAGERERLFGERLLTIEWQQRSLPQADETDPGSWLLVSTSTDADVAAAELADALKLHDAKSTTMTWPQQADHHISAEAFVSHLNTGSFRGVVVLTGPKSADPDKASTLRGRDYLRHTVRIARELSEISVVTPRLYVVSHEAQMVVGADQPNLEQAGLRGLVRVIGAEHPHLHATQIDLDDQTDSELLARQLVSGSEEDETAWRGGYWYTARLSLTPLRPDERRTAVVHPENDGMRLQIRTPGDLESIELTGFDRVPPRRGEIEVAVGASSVNFADVLMAFGRYPSFEGRLPQTGTDFAGVVSAVGPGVTTHRAGDRVGGISPNGCWASFVNCDARLAVPLPEALTAGQAAAITTAHATAWYALNDLARIDKGDRVLIHSATGGVGQAAIAIARNAGAEIFATAGSRERRELLRDEGIAHVYDSRSIEFAEQIRNDTDGYGVDIVLNSATGAAQRAGIDLLAFGGRFVEIGKRDIYGDSRLGLFPFRRNLAFHAVDLGLMSISHPSRVRELLNTVYRLTADGVLPPPQSTHYPLTDAATAIRAMAGANHTGKLVLDIPHAGSYRVALPTHQARVFRSDGAYVITGGLGGLGLFLAEKMVAGGAGRIVLSSRSQPTEQVLQTVEFIRAVGGDVVVVYDDITESGTADRLVATATATGLPLRGVLHAAAVVEDATLSNITDELIERDWAPKVYGAWNLHAATLNQPLDWFCSFSSAAALVGSPGQGAYAAANSWLDAFTHWRRTQGLPATSIAWGAWAEIGRAIELAESSGTAIAPEEGAHAFQTLLSHNRGYCGYAPTTGTPWLSTFAQRSPFAEAFRASGQSRRGGSEFLSELKALPPEEWPTRIRRMITEQISRILRRSVDPDRSLSEYGVDSLGNLELRTRIETETGIRITSTDITTVRGLADLLREKLAPEEEASAVA
jgi:polyketide synthase 5